MSLSPKRKGRLTGSVFAAAIGLNPYQSRQALYRQLVGIDPPFEGNEATQYGHDHESYAVDAYEAEMGVILDRSGDQQKFVIHPEHDWLGCTPDGYSGDIVVEFKCPYRQNLYPDVPDYYMPQIQGQMMITGKPECHFVCWTPSDLAVWRVSSSEDYQSRMLIYLQKFYELWKAGIEPPKMKKPTLPTIKTEIILWSCGN